jgi:hypothetical protein
MLWIASSRLGLSDRTSVGDDFTSGVIPNGASTSDVVLRCFTAIDDCTRIRVLKVLDACNQRTGIQFIDEVRRRLPFRLHIVQADNGAEFRRSSIRT